MEKRLATPGIIRELGPQIANEMALLEAHKEEVERLYTRWTTLSELEPYG